MIDLIDFFIIILFSFNLIHGFLSAPRERGGMTMILGAQKNRLIEKTFFSTNYMSEMTRE